MFRILKAVVTLVALVAIYQAAAAAVGNSMPKPARPLTPEEMAVAAYNSGHEHREKGVKAEEKAERAARESDRVKEQKKAREEYESAFKDFRKAAELNPQLPQAYNGMGFVYRKLGDHTKSLEMYDKAIALAPNFPDAIEYRGEAYLALNRLDDAKQAYLTLFAMDRKVAGVLLKAMTDYVAKKKSDPSGVDPDALSAFEGWIRERSGVAEATRAMAVEPRHGIWR
jgi:tetratricopeptide (TPR) repeat protein